MAKSTKPKSLGSLHKKLWDVFSLYVRYRDAERDRLLLDGEEVFCITCRKALPIVGGGLQAGHYISRGYKAVLYDERNVHAQCSGCNGPQRGNITKYYPKMVEMYGHEVVDELHRLANAGRQFKPYELEEMIAEYTLKLKDLIDNR